MGLIRGSFRVFEKKSRKIGRVKRKSDKRNFLEWTIFS
ncbi:hypothetical protein SAMN05421636_1045 [Pricia antarctica]|uniref:Uncharacterized protein n=1 Tax=Pricia antarctica TaxID=641691 RepID=A0A1G7B4S7_9FLAO|nr:hypothetical protein SAMN05421636_1045 [Pricia antarctica]